MREENERSLTRYDVRTLEPLPRVRILPRAYLNREPYGYPPSRPETINNEHRENGYHHSTFTQSIEEEKVTIPVEQTTLGNMISAENALKGKKKIREGNISTCRFFFLFQKYPALVAVIVSLLLNYGYRYDVNVKYLIEERVQIIMAFANGLLILVGPLYGIQNHNYSFKRVKFLSITKFFHLLLTTTAAVVQLVYSVLSYIKLNNNQNDSNWQSIYGQCDIKMNLDSSLHCYTIHDRIICSCILMGSAIAIIVLGLFSIASLLTAYINHDDEVKRLKKNQAKSISAYTNQTAFESTM
uniref:MARVEL domain-containing protein n=1 Tax=Parastrongyloides trichosuri TaxID=131310 RepID=A0A0N5A6A2_PARTI